MFFTSEAKVGKKVLQALVLLLGVVAFYAVLNTVFVSLWANKFEFRYYRESMTPQGVHNTIIEFGMTMLVAMMAGALCQYMLRRDHTRLRSGAVSIAALAIMHHWTQPVVEFLSYHPEGSFRSSYNIFTMVPWRGQWFVDSEELVALALASTVLFVVEMVRRDFLRGSDEPFAPAEFFAHPTGDSV